MDWIVAIGNTWLSTLAWLLGLAAAFGIFGRLMPCNPGMFWWKDRRAVVTDCVYWFVVPLFLSVGRTVMLIVGLALLFGGREPHVLPVQGLPLWQQCLAVLLLQDLMLYWLHRAFHTRLAWKFHAVHHSPTVLDWMSTQRSHPVNFLLEFALADVAVLLLGFPPAALVVLTPFNIVYSAMVHANLNWTFGPLRHVFASPVFHRWHHTTREEGLDKNFAPTFPFLDVLFGTFSMPAGKLPEEFGTGEPDFPQHFWGQLLHPFRTTAARPARRRYAVAALKAAGVLAAAGLLGAGAYYRTRPADRPRPSAPEAAAPRPRQLALQPVRPVALQGHTGPVLGVAVSADGACIVSGSADRTVKVWDAATGKEKLTLTGHTGPVSSVALSPDGGRIVSGSHDRTVRVWDAAAGEQVLALRGHTGPVYSVAVSADGRSILSAGWAAVKVWDAATGRERQTLAAEQPGAILSGAVSPDGRTIVSASWEGATVWDAETGRAERTLEGHTGLVHGVAFSPDGKRLVSASADGTVKVWEAATGREERTLKGHTGPVLAVACCPGVARIVSGSADESVRIWDAVTGRMEVALMGHADAVTSVAVSADGRCIVSGSGDGTVRVWDARAADSRGTVALSRRD
jgi:sterol desaturase/sphingolipid hydroxylase (fatty acid hydroxylase superfamily)/DNA-binding beta-propeller fold protein YncE